MSPNERSGRYRIIRSLGRGAMGDVYLALDTERNTQVALKIVYKGQDNEDREILEAERLGAELQKRVAAIDSRVCRVNRYGEINGDLFIDMEYIEGEDLSAILSRSPLAIGMAVRAGIELCLMLENLKAFTTEIAGKNFEGVIHGDLKPKNIRLTPQNHVKVLDFGIAKALSSTRKYTTNVFASTAYCSPERLETQRADAQSDLWSVGVLLYQMISGRLPFDDETRDRLERRIRSHAPPEPLPPGCPEPLRRIAMKALARDPGARYQSAAELARDLQRFERGEPVQAFLPDTDATVRTRVDSIVSPDETVRTQMPPKPPAARPRTRRSFVAMSCLTIVAIAVLSTVGFTLLEVHEWNEAEHLKSDVKTGNVPSLDAAFTRYETLEHRPHLPLTLRGARVALEKEYVAAADKIIWEYRESNAPQVFRKQWAEARYYLSRAQQLDPDNSSIEGELRLCEGHLDRIDAAGKPAQQRQGLLNAAEEKFEEAAQLLHKSPDPYLGLARLYVYDMNDVDEAEDALHKAVQRGHPMGKREFALLADGYRRRGDHRLRDSHTFKDNPAKEREYLENAREDYIRAENLYEQAGLFGDASRNQLLAAQGEQRIEDRLAELQEADRRLTQ